MGSIPRSSATGKIIGFRINSTEVGSMKLPATSSMTFSARRKPQADDPLRTRAWRDYILMRKSSYKIHGHLLLLLLCYHSFKIKIFWLISSICGREKFPMLLSPRRQERQGINPLIREGDWQCGFPMFHEWFSKIEPVALFSFRWRLGEITINYLPIKTATTNPLSSLLSLIITRHQMIRGWCVMRIFPLMMHTVPPASSGCMRL